MGDFQGQQVNLPGCITTMNSSSSGPRVVPQVAVTLKHFDANSLEGGAEADQGYDRHDFSATISKYLLADRCTAPVGSVHDGLPSGKRTKNYGKSPFLIGKSTIIGPFSIAMLNYQRIPSGYVNSLRTGKWR